ncbi:MAG: alpha/beta fold hydrolase [Bacillota bacterium]|nr:alpha/beta fold hydrolase [Bacillota bacterium]
METRKEKAVLPIAESWGNKEACLCIHGFGAAPGMYLPLQESIRSAGYDLYAPLLTGHGTKPADMRDVTAEQWQQDCREALEPLLDRYEKLHLIGSSMGGALCTYLAASYGGTGKIGKMLLMVPGYRLRNKGFYKLDYEKCRNTAFPLLLADSIPPELEDCTFLYDCMYLRSIGQLLRLGKLCERLIPQVSSPVWLLYAAEDAVVDPQCCRDAAETFSDLRECHAYGKSSHNLLLSSERVDVLLRIEAFLRA